MGIIEKHGVEKRKETSKSVNRKAKKRPTCSLERELSTIQCNEGKPRYDIAL